MMRGKREAPGQCSRSGKRPRRDDVSSWSGIPDDLLGAVLRRLPSFVNRARLPAVCRQWRASWRRQPHSSMPWLAYPAHCVCLSDAAVRRVAIQEDARAASCRGSFDNWLALVPELEKGITRRPFLLNPFSMERILLPPCTEELGAIAKIVLSSAPNSESCVIAAVAAAGDAPDERKIGVCWPGDASWQSITAAFDVEDIIFHQGKLHALTSSEELIVFDDKELDLLRREPWRPDEYDTESAAADELRVRRYLVECDGVLLMVNRYLGFYRTRGRVHYYSTSFMAFALKKVETEEWLPIGALDSRALFVGDACCRSFPVSAGPGLIGESKICFVDAELNMDNTTGPRTMKRGPSYAVEAFCMRSDFKNIAEYRPGKSAAAATRRWEHFMSRSSPAGTMNCFLLNRITVTRSTNGDEQLYAASRQRLIGGVAHLRPYRELTENGSSDDE